MEATVNNKPLISIIVVTYNSAKYVLETLESAKSQTYQNVELIISDDGSKDNTLQIVETWIKINCKRFKRTVIVRSEINTGTPTNANRGLKASEGEWIKLIAGDDILMSHCVESMLYFSIYKGSFISTSAIQEFCDENLPIRLSKSIYLEQMRFFNKSKDKQFQSYLRNTVFLNSPALFIKKELFEKVGYFDESLKILEDTPFILNVLRSGFSIYYNEIETVRYRTNRKTDKRLEGQISDTFICFNKYRLPYLSKLNIYDYLIRYDFFLFYHKRKSSNKVVILFLINLIRFTDVLYIKKRISEIIYNH